MKVIGITGGVGCGKSAVLSHIAFSFRCKIILTDEIAHMVKEPGELCYQRLVELLGKQVLDNDGFINKVKMGEMIFHDQELLKSVNEIIHPAVKAYVRTMIAEEQERGLLDFLFIEAALLIEDGYANIVDELWYIYSEESIRRKRLQNLRGYTKEKINAIMEKQLSEEDFYTQCKVVINNNTTLEEAYKQVEKKLGEYLCQM